MLGQRTRDEQHQPTSTWQVMQYEAHFENIVKCNQQMIKLSRQFEGLTDDNDALKFGCDLIGLQLDVQRQLISDI